MTKTEMIDEIIRIMRKLSGEKEPPENGSSPEHAFSFDDPSSIQGTLRIQEAPSRPTQEDSP